VILAGESAHRGVDHELGEAIVERCDSDINCGFYVTGNSAIGNIALMCINRVEYLAVLSLPGRQMA
jgi:hypothetical protein